MKYQPTRILAGVGLVLVCTILLLPSNIPRASQLGSSTSHPSSSSPNGQSQLALAQQSLALGHGPSGGPNRVPVPGNWTQHCHGPCSASADIVYDPVHQYVFLLYGCINYANCSSWRFSNNTWTALNLSGGPITFLNPTGIFPSMTWDAKDNYVLAFGGIGLVGGSWTEFNETWALQGSNWTKINALKSPSVRDSALMTYDPDLHSVLLFGGFNNSRALNDTWTYSGGKWSPHTRANGPPTSVAPRGMIYDTADHALLWLGASTTCCAYTQTWRFFANHTWSLLASSTFSPPLYYLQSVSLTYDAHSGEALLFGVWMSSYPFYSQTWVFSFANTTWVHLTIGSPPPGSFQGVVCYDPQLNRSFLTGYDQAGAPGDYLFNGTGWVQVFPTPPPREHAGLVFDEADHYVVLFGGWTTGGRLLSDTWEYSNGNWTQILTAKAPPARYNFQFAYDHGDNYALLFGGNGGKTALNDSWRFSGGTWSRLPTPHAPAARYLAVMAYDTADKYIVLFGGCNLDHLGRCRTYLNDTWRYSNGSWSTVLTSIHPPSLYGSAMKYYPAYSSLLLVGGQGPKAFPSTHSTIYGESWTFSHGKWSLAKGGGLLGSGAFKALMIYDPQLGFLILFGGLNSRGVGVNAIFQNGSWVQAAFGAYGQGEAAAWDWASHDLLLFGGSGRGPLDETLTFA